MDDEPDIAAALARLKAAARADLAALAWPDQEWTRAMRAPSGAVADDVLIVGAGQSGLVIAAALRREGVARVRLIDRAGPGRTGPWRTFARMAELRTPKALVGTDLGLPNLSARRWYETRYGAGAWDVIERIPRTDWHDYLEWYRDVLDIEIEHGVEVCDVRPDSGLIAVDTTRGGVTATRHARTVVLATGFDGGGAWRPPADLVRDLPRETWSHACHEIEFGIMRGKRVGVLGHGAAAFDNAIAALDAGARSADLCFRRARLPRTNPHRHVEYAGLMRHWPALDDATRWRIARHFRTADQPPPVTSFQRAMARSDFHLHPATPWLDLDMHAGAIRIRTPRGDLCFDHVIFATGMEVEMSARPELATLAPRVALWRERYQPPAEDADARLGALPYLDEDYAFLPREPADDWVRRVFAFSGASFVSHGPHSTSISGHKHALPRVVLGITRRLLLDQADSVVPDLIAADTLDLPIDPDFEDAFANLSREEALR